jgi:indolepyruvate ferredoxin oxidoreductase beta subunit
MQETLEYNIGICGIGGQGNIVAARVLANAAMNQGINVKIGELYGSAQRGGAVISHVRLGDVFAPLIPRGRANALISLEEGEVLRYAHLLMPKATVLVNQYQIAPTSVKIGKATYPETETIKSTLAPITDNVKLVNATEQALDLGNSRVANIIMIGALAGTTKLPMPDAEIEGAIKAYFPPKNVDINLDAFHRGKELGQS